MADEDEIDVLGDFSCNKYDNVPLVSQNAELTELLNCEYSINHQWSLDKPYGNSTGESHLFMQNASDVTSENSISDESGWTEKEKNLLQRGIEIFGKSNVRLAQFIGSKTASEVKYFLRNFYGDFEKTRATVSTENVVNTQHDYYKLNNEAEVLSENDIPASVEEVISVMSTAKPTVKVLKKPARKTDSARSTNKISSQRKLTSTVKRKFKFKAKLNVIKPLNKKPKSHYGEDKKKIPINIITGAGLSVPVCDGEQVIRLDKTSADSESDIEVDIEHSFEASIDGAAPKLLSVVPVSEAKKNEGPGEDEEKTNQHRDLSAVDKSVKELLVSLEVPKNEVKMDPDRVTELEKVINYEFFEGRPTKTPEKYLKIRNHIMDAWKATKPLYITKTSIRAGLKGDVKHMGRVHYFLEQIGAINFGCAQTNYVRPLIEMLQTPSVGEKQKETATKSQQPPSETVMRPRCKKKFINDGEGGCTLMHDETGEVINTVVVNEEPAKQRIYKKRSIRLIYCRAFNSDNPQKYQVYLHISALLLMDIHAHTSLTEVMGLVGGFWDSVGKRLTITHFEPCRNVASTLTHCDMCPVSQAKAADEIHGKGLSILGWFHSHPTFEPEPSQQDLDTQFYVQRWIGTDKPCVGIILTPFSLQKTFGASPFRCMIVDRKANFQDQYVPFKLDVLLDSSEFNVTAFLGSVRRLLLFDSNVAEESRVDFRRVYFQDGALTYFDKLISSIRMHISKSHHIDKATYGKIIQGLKSIFHQK